MRLHKHCLLFRIAWLTTAASKQNQFNIHTIGDIFRVRCIQLDLTELSYPGIKLIAILVLLVTAGILYVTFYGSLWRHLESYSEWVPARMIGW